MVMWTSHVERLDDGALLAAMAAGDANAATVFVRRHQRAVFGLAITMCGDPRLAEDVSQQTFERVWKHAGTYDARRAPVRAWMLTITRRLCIDSFRTNRSTPIDPFDLSALLPPASGSVEDAAVARAEVRGLHDALLGLPPEQRRVLLQASLGGRTAVEIAEIEQIPVGTVKTRLRLALARLRNEVRPVGVDDV
ncbi:MAG: sigma-70 region 2 [Acidimicrobiales bacterium]|nr:sigma-70 region 2 [Acidimicrobiales bacterium]